MKPSSPGIAPSTQLRLLAPLAVMVLGALAYSGALHGAFVFDDWSGVRDKLAIRDLGQAASGWQDYLGLPSRWFGTLTFALNYRLGGLNPFGYHALNIAIHLAAGLTLYTLVVLTFEAPRLRGSTAAPLRRTIALVAAALFVAHPLQTQAVTYVVQRYSSLSALLYLATVAQYARLRLRAGPGRGNRLATAAAYAGMLVTALLAMKTKETAFTLPVAVALYELLFLADRWPRRLLYLAPVLATLPVIPIGLVGAHTPVGTLLAEATQAARVQTTLSRADYLATELPVLVSYLRLLVWPAGQSIDHDVAFRHSFASPAVLGSGIALLALAGLAVWLAGRAARRGPRGLDPAALLAAFGIAWFFVTISVESSVIPIVDPMFEHRMYLPSAGLFTALAVGGAALARRLAPARPDRALAGAGLALAAVLAAVTFARNRVWADGIALWTDAVEKAPAKPRPRLNLGVALALAGRNAEAVDQLLAATRLGPANIDVYSNLGAALDAVGRRAEAVACLEADIREWPNHAEAYYNLGHIAVLEGDWARAADLLRRALSLRTDFPEASANLAAALNRQRRYAEAIAVVRGGGPRTAANAEARFNLGVALAATGDVGAATTEVRALEQLSPPLAAQLAQFVASQSAAQ